MADHSRPNFSAVFPFLQDQLACPACRASLRLEADGLICAGCGRRYAVVDGIPVLIPGE
ncbi:MAG: Trm112 family protein [Acidobacteriota bacterium]